jgi:hypothetical protein
VRHLRKPVKYKKIRGLKRKVSKIQNWIEEYLELDIEQLSEHKYHYSKVYIQPWDNLTLTNSEIPEPKGKAKKEIISGLEKIYDSWKKELDKLNEPYYLKIWLNEPRLSKSQVVCALGERIEHYESQFTKADFKQKDSSFTKQLSADFKWEPKLDEFHYWRNDLLWPIDQYDKIENAYADRRLLKKLEKSNIKKEKTTYSDGTEDIVFFVPVGKVWIGEK